PESAAPRAAALSARYAEIAAALAGVGEKERDLHEKVALLEGARDTEAAAVEEIAALAELLRCDAGARFRQGRAGRPPGRGRVADQRYRLPRGRGLHAAVHPERLRLLHGEPGGSVPHLLPALGVRDAVPADPLPAGASLSGHPRSRSAPPLRRRLPGRHER